MKARSNKRNKSQKSEIGELKSLFKRFDKFVRQGLLRFEERIENLEDGQSEIKNGQKRLETKVDKIDTALDGFVGRVDDLTTENEVGAGQYRDHNVRIENHEKRISELESPPSQQ